MPKQTHFDHMRHNMVMNQVVPMSSANEALVKAMLDVPREHFVPKKLASIAYADRHVIDKEGIYLIAPMLFAQMVTLLEVKSGMKILDVGTATGYSAAIFHHLGCDVTTIDMDDSMLAKAKKEHEALKITSIHYVPSVEYESSLEESSFDAIFIHGAVSEVPNFLKSLLKEDGKLVGAVINKKPPLKGQSALAQVMLMECHREIISQREIFTGMFPCVELFMPLSIPLGDI